MTVQKDGQRVTPAEWAQIAAEAREKRAAERKAHLAQAREWAQERAKHRVGPGDPAHAYVTQRLRADADNGYPVEEPWCFEGRTKIHLAQWHKATQHQPNYVVYYIRVGKFIKIGTTKNLDSRINSYPPGSKLLATEPGGYEVERFRHQQFAKSLSARKEWFAPSEALTNHIKALQRHARDEARNRRVS